MPGSFVGEIAMRLIVEVVFHMTGRAVLWCLRIDPERLNRTKRSQPGSARVNKEKRPLTKRHKRRSNRKQKRVPHGETASSNHGDDRAFDLVTIIGAVFWVIIGVLVFYAIQVWPDTSVGVTGGE